MNALADAVNRMAETWWTFAANVSWQAALVGLAALLLVRFSRRQPAPLRYGLLLIALIKFACPPMLSAPIGLFSRCTPAAWRQAAADATSLAELEENAFTRPPARLSPHESIDDAALPPVDAAPTIAEAAARPSEAVVVEPDEIELASASARPQLRDLAQRTPSAAPSSSRVRLSWKSWLMLLHLTGVLLLAGWTAWQLRLLGRLVRSSCEIIDGPRYEQYLMLCQTLKLRRPPRLLESREAVSPMALGLWRPSVLIPAGVLEALPPGDARTVFGARIGSSASRRRVAQLAAVGGGRLLVVPSGGMAAEPHAAASKRRLLRRPVTRRRRDEPDRLLRYVASRRRADFGRPVGRDHLGNGSSPAPARPSPAADHGRPTSSPRPVVGRRLVSPAPPGRRAAARRRPQLGQRFARGSATART